MIPGDNVSMEIELITPVAMDKGHATVCIYIREGGRTVGAGTVTEILSFVRRRLLTGAVPGEVLLHRA